MSLVVGSHSFYQSYQMKLFEDIKTWITVDTIVNLSFHLISQRFGCQPTKSTSKRRKNVGTYDLTP